MRPCIWINIPGHPCTICSTCRSQWWAIVELYNAHAPLRFQSPKIYSKLNWGMCRPAQLYLCIWLMSWTIPALYALSAPHAAVDGGPFWKGWMSEASSPMHPCQSTFSTCAIDVSHLYHLWNDLMLVLRGWSSRHDLHMHSFFDVLQYLELVACTWISKPAPFLCLLLEKGNAVFGSI